MTEIDREETILPILMDLEYTIEVLQATISDIENLTDESIEIEIKIEILNDCIENVDDADLTIFNLRKSLLKIKSDLKSDLTED